MGRNPLRVDMIDNFPDYVAEDAVVALLAAVGLLAEKIEDQLGYPIVEMGEVVPVPEGLPPDWNKDPRDYRRNCWLPDDGKSSALHGRRLRLGPSAGHKPTPAAERSPIFGRVWSAVSTRPPASGPVRIWVAPTTARPCTSCFTSSATSTSTTRIRTRESACRGPGRLFRTPGAQSVTWSDVDVLRCIFPEADDGRADQSATTIKSISTRGFGAMSPYSGRSESSNSKEHSASSSTCASLAGHADIRTRGSQRYCASPALRRTEWEGLIGGKIEFRPRLEAAPMP